MGYVVIDVQCLGSDCSENYKGYTNEPPSIGTKYTSKCPRCGHLTEIPVKVDWIDSPLPKNGVKLKIVSSV